MFTPRGGLKPVPAKKTETGSSIDLGQSAGWTQGHFTTTTDVVNKKVSSSRLYVRKQQAPNKNCDSEPGLWGSVNDFPPRETFTTTRALMDQPDKSRSRMRKSCMAAKSEMNIGYKEAEAKNPWKTTSMRQFKDPLLGARKKGPTALPQPIFPNKDVHVNPLTGENKTCKANLFERYQRDEVKHLISNDQLYKREFNVLNSSINPVTGYKSFAKTYQKPPPVVQKHPRPTLGSLGAIRP